MVAARVGELAEAWAPALPEGSLGREVLVVRAGVEAWGGGACVRDGAWAAMAFSSVFSTEALPEEGQARK